MPPALFLFTRCRMKSGDLSCRVVGIVKLCSVRTFSEHMCREKKRITRSWFMADSYYPDYSEHSDQQLDELLCEYVDGTMDPAVRAAFEEYLEVNPQLASHARCLCQTRTMLCSYGWRHPEESLQEQIRKKVVGELKRQDRVESMLVHRLDNAAMLTSSISLILIVGMMIGFSAVNESRTDNGSEPAAYLLEDTMSLRTDAYSQQSRARSLEQLPSSAQLSPLGLSPVLPVIDMQPIGWHAVGSQHIESSFDMVVAP